MRSFQRIILGVLLSLFTFSSFAQGRLHVADGSSLLISSGSSLSVDRLVLTPSSDFTISGVNNVLKSASASNANPTSYINRVYQFSTALSSFSGGIAIHYDDADLNSLSENSLLLNIHDGNSWNLFHTNVTRNPSNNVVTTTGLSEIDLNEITLASEEENSIVTESLSALQY